MEAPQELFRNTQAPRWLLVFGAIIAIAYFYIITFWFEPSNRYLYAALITGQVFLVWQVLTYIHTVWNTERRFLFDPTFKPTVDVFITVCGEPRDIVAETVRAVKAMDYPDFRIYILNDGLVAKKENWKEIEKLAKELHVHCITRKTPGGAKAGNINNGFRSTSSKFVVIFDADHVPHVDFLEKTIGYFVQPKVGFVQTPQYYKNRNATYVAQASWEQQELFFGPICKGKNNYNAATMCGTNMVIRREALAEVGGMSEESVAEDFLTGLFMHECGWQSIYLPLVLAEGLAPEDFLSYFKQQWRWGRGALDVLLNYNPLTRRGLTFSQKIQYLSSASFFISGVVVLMDALFPLIFLFTGAQPFVVTTMTLAAIFLPYMFITLQILDLSSSYGFTFNALAFSMGSFGIQLSALANAIFGKKASFSVTSKKQIDGNFTRLVIPQISYLVLTCLGVAFAVSRSGFSPAVANNIAWALGNCCIFFPVIAASFYRANRAMGTSAPSVSLVAAPVAETAPARVTNES